MHDPVDRPSDQTSSLGVRAPGELADGESRAAMGTTTAPLIQLEPEPTASVAPDGSDHDLRDDREKAQLVTPTMWR